MRKDIKFSIIVPCYNVELYITECVESVINQTYENWELLLVDDASQDNTYSIIKDLQKSDKRIQVYTKKHGGPAHTRNYGMQHIAGDYLALLDGDDYWSIDHLKNVLNIIEGQFPDMIVQNQHTNFTQEGMQKTILFPIPKKELTSEEKLDCIFSIKNCLPAAAVLTTYRIDFLKTNKLKYTEQYLWSEDLDFFLSAISCMPKIMFADHEFYYYRQDNINATTKSITGKKELHRLFVYKKWFDYYKGKTLGTFDCEKIRRKIAKEMLTQLHVYRSIPKNDSQKRQVKKYLISNRYIYGLNGRKGSFFYAFYIEYPLQRLKNGIFTVYDKMRHVQKH